MVKTVNVVFEDKEKEFIDFVKEKVRREKAVKTYTLHDLIMDGVVRMNAGRREK